MICRACSWCWSWRSPWAACSCDCRRSTTPPFSDELSTYYIVNGHSLGRVLQLVHSNQETSPPLYFVLVWAVRGLLGSGVESIRLISLVTGTAAIPLDLPPRPVDGGAPGCPGRRDLRRAGSFHDLHPTQARPFMLVLFFALLSTLSLLRALDTGRLGWWAAYAAGSCAAAYTHYTVVFLLVAELGWALWDSAPGSQVPRPGQRGRRGGLSPVARRPARGPPRTEQQIHRIPRHVP